MNPSGILTATWYIYMYWELLGGDMSVSNEFQELGRHLVRYLKCTTLGSTWWCHE